MRRQARRLILVAAARLATLMAVATLAGCAATTPPPPARLLVHVDTLDASKVQQFEAARARWVTLLRTSHRTDRRGLYLKIGGNTYYSLVSFARWSELDALAAERGKTVRALGAAADEYDRLSDESLVFPHASEIWRAEPALSYLPTGRPLTEAVQLVIEDVKPTADYQAAWKPIAAALAQVRYPLERRTFFSSYGSGRTLSFWLASSTAVMKAAPTLQQALTAAVGEPRAQELLAGWRACVLSSQTLEVEARPEMSTE